MTTITTIVTVAPSLFDLHYWYFGMFIIFAITALLTATVVSQTNIAIASDTFVLITMIGMFAGSIVALVMDMIPWIVSVVFFLLLLLVFWRSRA